MNMEKRVDDLERKAVEPGPLPDLVFYSTDARITDDPEPDRLVAIVKAGTFQKKGQAFHRGPGETETGFKNRVQRIKNNG